MSSILNESGLKSFLDDSLQMREKRKRQHLIEWPTVTCFYEDSEGDMNVVSEDEDLKDAYKYLQSKRLDHLELSILDRNLYKQFRDEQDRHPLNQS
jgi:hypothetical protein